MKKSSFFFLSAIALSGVFGLASCSSDEKEIIDNPNYDPLTKTVNANFVFSVSTGNTASTRQTAANTQATIQEAFRGIENAQLATYSLPNNGSWVTSNLAATQIFNLGTVLGKGNLDPDGDGLNASGAGVPLSHRIIELLLPTETNTLMFWGKAIKDDASAAQGEISFDPYNPDISKHAFSLSPRIPNSSTNTRGQDAYTQFEKIIIAALNKIAQTSISDKDFSYGANNAHINTLSWSDYVDLTKSPLVRKTYDPSDVSAARVMCPLGSVLGNAFATFHNIRAGEIRAGSGAAIASMMAELLTAINNVIDTPATSLQEVIAQEVAVAVRNNINLFFNLTAVPEWLGVNQVIGNTNLNTTQVSLVVADASADLNEFPVNFNVPMGAAHLAFTPSTCEWSFDEGQSHQTIGVGGAAGVFDYMYPAELCYFGNSAVRVSNDEKEAKDYPDGTVNWESDGSWTGWTTDGRVEPLTRSVAMKDNINYGTALLESTVRYGSNIMEDNNHAVQKAINPALANDAEQNKLIEVSSTSFKLTGIIIGGQAKTMGWNYLAKDGTSASFNNMIYDNALTETTIPNYTGSGNKSKPNYTLVWDNWSEALKGQDQSTVYVALEFVNNTGEDFFGKDNKIPAGSTFYIVGKLDPDKRPADMTSVTDEEYKNDKSLGITWPSRYALPPYNADGSTVKERRVFMQDYMTTANFILNRESLQKAYVGVPDLRALQISLGMSVDLQWQTGLTFDVILGE